MMMIKLIFLLLSPIKPRKSEVSAGFTLVEVIVAMLILSIFIVTALTALVSGLNVKLKSKLANEATLIIQQDLEDVRYKAAIYGSPTVSDTPTVISAANPSALTLTVPVRFTKAINANEELNVGIEKKVGSATPPYKLTSDSTIGQTSMAVTADLTKVSTASSTTLTEALTTGAKTSIKVKVADTSKIKAGDLIVIGSNTSATLSTTVVKDYGIDPVAGVINVNSFTVPSAGYDMNTPVRVLPRSGDIIDTVTNTEADATRCKNGTIASTFKPLVDTGDVYLPKSFNKRDTYTLKRKVTEAKDLQSDNTTTKTSVTRIQILYGVRDTAVSPNQDLSTLIAEVIPSVAYQCP